MKNGEERVWNNGDRQTDWSDWLTEWFKRVKVERKGWEERKDSGREERTGVSIVYIDHRLYRDTYKLDTRSLLLSVPSAGSLRSMISFSHTLSFFSSSLVYRHHHHYFLPFHFLSCILFCLSWDSESEPRGEESVSVYIVEQQALHNCSNSLTFAAATQAEENRAVASCYFLTVLSHHRNLEETS